MFGGFFGLVWFLKLLFMPLIWIFWGGIFLIWFLKLLFMFLFPLKLQLMLSCFLLRVFGFLRIEVIQTDINIVLRVHMFQAHRSTGNTKLSKADNPALVLVLQNRIQAMN